MKKYLLILCIIFSPGIVLAHEILTSIFSSSEVTFVDNSGTIMATGICEAFTPYLDEDLFIFGSVSNDGTITAPGVCDSADSVTYSAGNFVAEDPGPEVVFLVELPAPLPESPYEAMARGLMQLFLIPLALLMCIHLFRRIIT